MTDKLEKIGDGSVAGDLPSSESVPEKPRLKSREKDWCATKVRQIFAGSPYDSLVNDALERSFGARVLDFSVSPGRVSGRTLLDQTRPIRVDLIFPQLTDSNWSSVLSRLSLKAFFLAKLLARELPQEIEEIFSESGCHLFPESLTEITVECEPQENQELEHKAVACTIARLIFRLEEDPFSIFLLRGRGQEEVLMELRRRRREDRDSTPTGLSLGSQQINYHPAPALNTTLDNFWNAGKELWSLSYSIRADELPAAILKRLDPLPLSGLEEIVEPHLEEAYARVASRAQGYGLGLN